MNNNIFHDLPDASEDEIFESIIERDDIIIERIVSNGQSTPEDEWLQEPNDEWVILLKGTAGIEFEGDDAVAVLTPGDFIHIPANERHRVDFTADDQTTIWLAVHFSPSS